MSFILSIVPGFIIYYWLKKKNLLDRNYKKVYLKIFVLGAITVISACELEEIGSEILLTMMDENSLHYIYYDNFLVTSFSEEVGKFIVMLLSIKLLKNKSESNFIVAGIFVGLGFGIAENILYSLDTDVFAMIIRAIYCVPGHALYGLYMGYFLYLAYFKKHILKNVFLAFFIPFLHHGIYDFCLSSDIDSLMLWTLIYNLVLYYYAIKLLQYLCPKEDSRFKTLIPEYNAPPNTHRLPITHL